jgi:predicted Fe-S protein YdhL (DUF1289 family)
MPRIHVDVATLADPRPDPEPWTWLDRPELRPRIRIGLTPTWGADVVGYDPRHGQRCPACHDATLRESEVCLVCSSTRAAPRRWAMMDKSERAAILRGPAPLGKRVAVVMVARTRRERRGAARKAG